MITRVLLERLLRAWVPLVVIVAFALGGVAVYRLSGIFGSDQGSFIVRARSEKIVPTNPKRVEYEIFGPSGTSGMISYLDEKAHSVEAGFTALPWSFSITTTLPSVVANILAQGNSASIGCRIIVNGVVRDEQVADARNAATFCLVKAA